MQADMICKCCDHRADQHKGTDKPEGRHVKYVDGKPVNKMDRAGSCATSGCHCEYLDTVTRYGKRG